MSTYSLLFDYGYFHYCILFWRYAFSAVLYFLKVQQLSNQFTFRHPSRPTGSKCGDVNLRGSSDRYDVMHDVFQLLGVNVTSSVRTDYVISGDNIIQSAETQESWSARVNMDTRLTAMVQTRQQLTYKESSRKLSTMDASSVDELMKKLSEGNLLASTPVTC